jgi:uncharacterized protein (TIGR04255 family)
MPELGGWHPAKEAHAIVRAGLTVAFSGAIGDVAWRRLEKDVALLATSMGLNERQPLGIVGLPAPVMALIQNSGAAAQVNIGAIYQRRQPPQAVAEKLQLGPNNVRYELDEYVRWDPMKARFRELAAPALREYGSASSVSTISVDYVDAFVVRDAHAKNDISAIIPADCPAVARAAFRADELWHTHSGWFDYPDAFTRRLTNIFVDVEQALATPGRPHTIRIRTLQQDQFGQAGLAPAPDNLADWQFVEARIDSLHYNLKELLRTMLTPGAAEMIALDQ